jgi:peptidylprolyl isomerase
MNKYIIVILVIVVLGGLFTLNDKNRKSLEESSKVENYADVTTVDTNTSTEIVGEIKNETTTSTNKKENIMYAILKTNMGDIKIEFLEEQAPNTVANFKTLASENFYNGVKFHRVIKGFMIQGGDPLTKDDTKQALWGTGGPGYKFDDEITDMNSNAVGTISMANAGPNTNGSQFFINVNANNFLDSKHTVFGKVVAGMDVVTKIENTPTAPGDRPLSPVIIESIVLE